MEAGNADVIAGDGSFGCCCRYASGTPATLTLSTLLKLKTHKQTDSPGLHNLHSALVTCEHCT